MVKTKLPLRTLSLVGSAHRLSYVAEGQIRSRRALPSPGVGVPEVKERYRSILLLTTLVGCGVATLTWRAREASSTTDRSPVSSISGAVSTASPREWGPWRPRTSASDATMYEPGAQRLVSDPSGTHR